ncbi:hypothetical protein HPB51_021275 [Rhipicephalus microplus]|uniref:Hcy-binding domain-containing protein n=1 Tax=Rhipicephalus microplus TaxID=6941 RepID=A0A9J6F7P2_RHIMP|nr:hypothetical protein HPB51_021275 [Rhipicephalus microplus]
MTVNLVPRNSDAKAVRVVGSVGPYDAYLYDSSEYNRSYADRMSVNELLDWHRPRVRILERGSDLLAFETGVGPGEAAAYMKCHLLLGCEAHMVAPLLSGVWKSGRPPLVARPDAEFHEVGVFGQPPKDREKL